MVVLGISAYYHDSAAALLRGDQILAAAQEERFTRRKYDARFPRHAIEYCLQEADIGLGDLDFVAFYDKPFLKFERLLETYVAFAPKGFSSFRAAIPIWLREKLFLKDLLQKELKRYAPGCDWGNRLRFSEHHLSHAASAYFPSPFDEAAVLTMDGVGEWATTSLAIGRGNKLEVVKEIHFPHSIGLLYSAFTYYTGFKVNSSEYKVMGLAPYGVPKHAQLILDHLIDLKDDGSFRLDQSYFNYCTGLTMSSGRFHELFWGPPRKPNEPLTQHHMDLAASVQVVTEEIVLRLTRSIAKDTGIKNLCLAGGVALNCVANGKVLRDGQFTGLWIQPAAGDAGGALGAALAVQHIHCDLPRTATGKDTMRGSYLGPSYSRDEAAHRLRSVGASYDMYAEDKLVELTARALSEGKAVGWFQGRMEFGPRALGNRSILGDPRNPAMQKILNLKIKFRESFRPFAAAILRESVADWFDLNCDSPYMLLVANVKANRKLEMTETEKTLFGIDKLNIPRSDIPAITHIDYSARVQTVHRETNPRFHKLIASFARITGCPVLVNTSFNVRGEPIVGSPEDAFRCFMGTGLDMLIVEDCLLLKERQDVSLKNNYAFSIEPD